MLKQSHQPDLEVDFPMKKAVVTAKEYTVLIERLAAIEHTRWADWQQYVHNKGLRQPDGSILLPSECVKRWERQISTAYKNLTEAEKESDREQVLKYLPILLDAPLNKK